MNSTIPSIPGAVSSDLDAVKTRQQAAWSCGDYSVIGTTLQIVGEQICESLDLRAGQRVLDVAAGNGNASLAAARRHCEVVSTDYVQSLLDRARERAAAERLSIGFRVADAEALPFATASFDAVVSTFGVMFTPDQERAAAELVRVCRPRGRIGLANWTPEGFVGRMFATIARYLPPPAGTRSPMEWGTRKRLGELFARHAIVVDAQQRHFVFRYRSAEHLLEVFKLVYGPMVKAFAVLDGAKQAALTADLLALIRQCDSGAGRGLVVASEYLDVVVTRA
ncbi:MAG: methyltransferase domain-containing protein [Planctomycetes bacterium]|nr:methyltransferase domain-containing protein [Planctomycetota bacterium]